MRILTAIICLTIAVLLGSAGCAPIRNGYFPDIRMSGGGTYSGNFINNKLNGQGTYIWTNGDKYVGEWKNGKKHRQGPYPYASGNKWVGEYRNGKVWDGNGPA